MEISFTKFVACYLALMRFTDNKDFILVLKSFFHLLDEDSDGWISAQDITEVCADSRLPINVARSFVQALADKESKSIASRNKINFGQKTKLHQYSLEVLGLTNQRSVVRRKNGGGRFFRYQLGRV